MTQATRAATRSQHEDLLCRLCAVRESADQRDAMRSAAMIEAQMGGQFWGSVQVSEVRARSLPT